MTWPACSASLCECVLSARARQKYEMLDDEHERLMERLVGSYFVITGIIMLNVVVAVLLVRSLCRGIQCVCVCVCVLSLIHI